MPWLIPQQCCGSISDLDKPAQEEISPLVSLCRAESSSKLTESNCCWCFPVDARLHSFSRPMAPFTRPVKRQTVVPVPRLTVLYRRYKDIMGLSSWAETMPMQFHFWGKTAPCIWNIILLESSGIRIQETPVVEINYKYLILKYMVNNWLHLQVTSPTLPHTPTYSHSAAQYLWIAGKTWPLGVTQRSQNMGQLASRSSETKLKKITQSHFFWTSTVIIPASSWKLTSISVGEDHAGGIELHTNPPESLKGLLR